MAITDNTGRALTEADLNLWETILWATTDLGDEPQPLDRNYSIADVDRQSIAKINDQWWQFRDETDHVFTRHGLEDATLDGLWPTRAEHCYALVRDGHGVSFTDDYLSGSRCHAVAEDLNLIAKRHGPIDAYVGDDGRIYCS